MKKDKKELVISLEDRLNILVRQWRNSSEEERIKYEPMVKKLSREYFIMTSQYYKWKQIDTIYSRQQIREANDFGVVA